MIVITTDRGQKWLKLHKNSVERRGEEGKQRNTTVQERGDGVPELSREAKVTVSKSRSAEAGRAGTWMQTEGRGLPGIRAAIERQ